MTPLPPIDHLTTLLEKLPGVGRRSARRMAFALVQDSTGLARRLAEALLVADEQIGRCSCCGGIALSGEDPCPLCNDPARGTSGLLCAVETPEDIIKIEQAGGLNGRYHVLNGHLSPALGKGVAELRINELLGRLRPEGVREVILALGTGVESDATASYLADLLASRGVKVSRPALGLPAGSSIEHTDAVTLQRAIQGRQACS